MIDFLPQVKKQPINFKPKRFIIVGDPHFGIGANDEFFFRSMINYMRQIFLPWMQEHVKPGDAIVFMGDIFDNDTTLRTEVHDAVMALFEKFAQLAVVVGIVGNHDVVRKRSNEINSLRGIGQIPGVFIYYQPTIWECAYNRKVLFYPWVKEIETIEEFEAASRNGCSIMASHTHYNGLAFDNEYVKKENGEIKSIDVKDLKMFDIVINGHIHRKQDLLNIMNVGAPWQMKYSDDNNVCGFHILDLKDLKKQFNENMYSPRFYQAEISAVLNMTKEEAQQVVTNKLCRISYPAELAKTFSLDIVRRELEGAISVEFQPEYKYSNDESSKMSEKVPEIVDLKSIMESVARSMQVSDEYADSLVDELHQMYMQKSKIETTEL